MKKHLIKYYLLLRNAPLLFVKAPKILSFEETINEIVKHKKSISRYGDGEIRMMLKSGGIGFQNENEELSERLTEVVSNPIDNLLICLPDTFRHMPENKIDSQIFWLGFNMLYAKKFIAILPDNQIYGNAGITRFYEAYKNKESNHIKWKIAQLKSIWDKKDLLIVEGSLTRLGVGNDLFSNAYSINRLICPSKNAFDKYEQILKSALELGKDKLILIALGPTASVLAYDLAKEGFWALDIGHIDIEYSWFLQGVNEKTAVKGKYVNEAGGSGSPVIDDDIYKNTVIREIE